MLPVYSLWTIFGDANFGLEKIRLMSNAFRIKSNSYINTWNTMVYQVIRTLSITYWWCLPWDFTTDLDTLDYIKI